MKFMNHLENFREYLSVRNYSEQTIISYMSFTKYFLVFLETHYPRIKQINQVTKEIIADYSRYLMTVQDRKEKTLSNKTKILKLSTIKTFFRFLVKNDYILKDPTASLEMPRNEKTLPRNILSEKEVKLILDSIKLTDPVNIRNRAIIELFYSCGLRTSELASIKLPDIDLTEQTVFIVKGKGHKTRLCPLTQYACEYIRLYLEKSRRFMLLNTPHDEGYLFLTERGTKFTVNTLNKCVITKVTQGLGINKKITCYTFRHSLGTHLIGNKVDIRFVGELLGHESLNTTMRYCHVTITDLKKQHALHHPRELD